MAVRKVVEFDISKIEAVLCSRKRKYQESKVKMKVQVEKYNFVFNKKPTRWLGIQLDHKLRFQHQPKVIMAKAKNIKNQIRSIITRYGLNSANARKVQVVGVQLIALYGVELRWDNQSGRE